MPTEAGYSGTPLGKKLGIKEGHRVAILHAPTDFVATLELPAEVTVAQKLPAKPCDVILLFTTARTDLEKAFPSLKERLTPAGGLWVAWPKKAAKVATDLTENVVREIALRGGLVDNKVCAIDATWSGLRLVFRRKDRPQ